MIHPSPHHLSFAPLRAVAGLVLSLWCAAGQCQSSGYLTREQVRAETIAASRAHLLVPAGEATFIAEPIGPRSSKTWAQQRAETLAARDAGALLPAGEAGARKAEHDADNGKSDRTRAQVRAETEQAATNHQLLPAGEGTLVERR